MASKKAAETGGGLIYIGDGSYLPFVPARDLTAAEVERYQEHLNAAKESGTFERLYKPAIQPGEVNNG